MRVLNIVKTNFGAAWAFDQAKYLHEHGVEIINVLPNDREGFAQNYLSCNMRVISADLSLPVLRPWKIFKRIKDIKNIVKNEKPDIIHCHFVTNILMLRIALRNSKVFRLFQVPGPLHLESGFYRRLELFLSNKYDFWGGACKKTCEIYKAEGIAEDRVFLTYYGGYGGEKCSLYPESKNILHTQFDLNKNDALIGMVSYFYKPKKYLLQKRGIKGHEDFIDAMKIVIKQYPDAKAIIIGGPWGSSHKYEALIKEYAKKQCGDSVIFAGFRRDIKDIYREIDVAVHPSHSENLGGAAESLAAGVPTVSTNVGGFPDIVIDGETGYTVSAKKPEELATVIIKMLNDNEKAEKMALKGQELVRSLLDIENTGNNMLSIYNKIMSAKG